MNTAEKLSKCRAVVAREYGRKHSHPWVVAYSGGKDSTLLLQVTWEVLAGLPESARHREVHVVGNDTLVESPLVIRHLRASMDRIAASAAEAGLPIRTRITRPNIDQTFWVNVIGRGYIPPTRNFRWCTDRMKILPTGHLLEGLVKRHGRAVLLVGTRKSESEQRRRNMAKRRVSATSMNAHGTIAGCRVFAPLADLHDEDVWKVPTRIEDCAVLKARRHDVPPLATTRQRDTLYRQVDRLGRTRCPHDLVRCGLDERRHLFPGLLDCLGGCLPQQVRIRRRVGEDALRPHIPEHRFHDDRVHRRRRGIVQVDRICHPHARGTPTRS